MWVNDPSEKALVPERFDEIADDEPRDYHEFFWDEGIQRGRFVSWQPRIHTQVCRFDGNGGHVSMAQDCPHFEVEDEMGRNIPSNWTVQSG